MERCHGRTSSDAVPQKIDYSDFHCSRSGNERSSWFLVLKDCAVAYRVYFYQCQKLSAEAYKEQMAGVARRHSRAWRLLEGDEKTF
jgi:hypothetical protein